MLRTLLLSRDTEAVRAMSRALKDLGVELEECPDQSTGIKRIQAKRFNAIIADDAVRGSHDLLERAREVPGNEKTIRILLASDATTITTAFRTGTQVVLYKPLTAERLRHGLRAVRNLMAKEFRRGAKRFRVEIPAKLWQGKLKNVAAKIVDLSETGAALQGARELDASVHFTFECTLPDGHGELKGSAEIVWHDRRGICGVRFTDVPAQARKRLTEWLQIQSKESSEELLPAVAATAQHR